ncbi:MAG: M1 family metallopeptidase [Salibacteraceae bacterium]
MRVSLSAVFIVICSGLFAQSTYWQQEVDYKMDIDFDVNAHRFEGTQKLVYTNHSPDTLNKVFYHLYFNAFKPGSMMDVRSRTRDDPDQRILDRIARLNDDEIGYHDIKWLKQDGKKLDYKVVGTVLEVSLDRPILPGENEQFDMRFKSQVPVQIRRSGRNNNEGIDYTLTQWYPKMAEYDQDGWHTEPYIAREFQGVFGSFEVNITIDSGYTVAGTGVVQNPEEVGHGYGSKTSTTARNTWRFKAEKVHDFAWAADPEYSHTSTELSNGTKLHFFYFNDSSLIENWTRLVPYTVELFNIMNERFGEYPYPQFSVIQGGDGGMEYPMCTMISGTGSFGGLVSVTVHEAIHNWYYGVLASNESKYPWMDEGFTTFAQNIVLDSLFSRGKINPHERSYRSYIANAKTGNEEPLSTHADWYESNRNYGVNAYSKGCVFVNQMRFIIGDETFEKGMLRYFDEWKFKHPTPLAFKRTMEKASGIELDWYVDAWVGTTKSIDYAIENVIDRGKTTDLELERIGSMPFPLEIEVIAKGEKHHYYIPLEVMRGEKPKPKNMKGEWHIAEDWPWVYPSYRLELPFSKSDISSIIIDPDRQMADTNPQNQFYPKLSTTFPFEK